MQATTILLEIAARASTLRERIEGRYVHAESVAESEIARQRLTVWKDAVARGENTVFLRRLDWDELGSVESLPLGKPSIINTEQLPDWVSTVGEILELAPRVFELDVDGTATKDKRLSKDDNEFLFLKGQKFPFQELVSPAVLVATDRLKERLGDDLKECLPEALAGMQQSLLYELTEFGKQVFQRKFTLGRLLGKSSEPGGPSSYVLYLDRMLNQKGLETTFREYPVLARMMACAVDAWVEDTHCFLERLTRDLQELERVFCESTPLGSLVHVDDALSDAHHGRRFVKRLTFSGGNSIIYKPRDVGLLAALQEFVKQLQSLDQNIDLKALQVLDKKSYGWVESVSHEPCEDESGGARFFERSGSLLAVFYLLQGTDCHKENLIAVGEHPVIIDAETLINPSSEIKSEEDAPELNLVGRRASDDSSVLTTGMLPRWDAIGPSTDVSALGAVVEQVLAESTVRWVDVNTDKMRRVEEPSISQPLANNAYFKDTTFIPNDYVDQIVTGFRRVCTAVNENKTKVLNTWLDVFNGCSTRLIFRPTRIYSLLHARLQAPAYLTDGADYSIQLEMLARPFVFGPKPPSIWPILRSELGQLEGLDIPMFSIGIKDRGFDVDGTHLPLYSCSAFQAVQDKIRDLKISTIDREVDYIRASCYARVAANTPLRPGDVNSSVDEAEHETLADQALLEAARKLTQDIRSRSLGEDSSSLSWIGLNFIPTSNRYQLGPVGLDLYSGNAGIGLLFAAEAAVLRARNEDDTDAMTMAKGAFGALLQVPTGARAASSTIEILGIGGVSGLGSMIYALSAAGRMLEHEEWIDGAHELSKLITTDAIASDSHLDVMNGCAGTLLGLLALSKIRPSDRVSELAERCGERLLATRIDTVSGLRAWPTLSEQVLTGLSHGAAGISLALLRLFRLTGRSEFHDAALEGVSYENAIYSETLNNWPDLREEEPTAMVSWCHGAIGIGLARLASLEIENSSQLKSDALKSIDIASRTTHNGVDQLCCGAMGRVELFLSASEILSRPELAGKAKESASSVVHSAGPNNLYRLINRIPRDLSLPSFFQGRAGIAYELFRLVHPKLLPSVLTHEVKGLNEV